MKKIYDPLYGLIEFNDIETLVLDTPLFQRLRYIKQLGLAHYVYPSVNHSRFSHSIGVFYITNKIGGILQKQNEDLLSNYYLKNLRMAALLHDIGHFPFSHVLEFNENDENFKKLPEFFKLPHEELGVHIIENSYLKEIITEDDDEYNIDLICNLILGNDIADNPILSKIIKWELDADRLDYLLRDSYFSGIKYGIVDLDYLINNYEIHQTGKLVINEKASRSIENFLIARFSLYDRLYTHKNCSFFDYILKITAKHFLTENIYPSFNDFKSLNDILKNEENSERIYELTDFSLFKMLNENYNKFKSEKTDKNNIISNLRTILFRNKPYQIKLYQCITNAKMSLIELVDFKILKVIENLIKENKNDLLIDIPKNRFTKYESIFYPAMGLDEDNINEIKEQEMKSIWISQKNEDPQLFYEWKGTYFKQLYASKNIKYLIYLNKSNTDLIEKFEKIENDISTAIDSI